MQAIEPPGPVGENDDLQLLREAARKGGEIAMRYFRRNPRTWLKDGDSPVSEADHAVDRYLRQALTAARPDYGWVSEESEASQARATARRIFIVDPIDGTRAFLQGDTTWCVCVAVVEHGVPVAGVLHCAALDESFEAMRGYGAFRNARPIAVTSGSESPLVAGPKTLLSRTAQGWPANFRHGRYFPSLAYRIAMVASGELDATLVKPLANDWDLAAADVILREAGGKLLDMKGQELSYGGDGSRHGALVAGNAAMAARLAAMMADLSD